MSPDRVFLIYDQEVSSGRRAISLVLAPRFTVFFVVYSSLSERIRASQEAQEYAVQNNYVVTGSFAPHEWVEFTRSTSFSETSHG